jgi:hypothetical protein
MLSGGDRGCVRERRDDGSSAIARLRPVPSGSTDNGPLNALTAGSYFTRAASSSRHPRLQADVRVFKPTGICYVTHRLRRLQGAILASRLGFAAARRDCDSNLQFGADGAGKHRHRVDGCIHLAVLNETNVASVNSCSPSHVFLGLPADASGFLKCLTEQETSRRRWRGLRHEGCRFGGMGIGRFESRLHCRTTVPENSAGSKPCARGHPLDPTRRHVTP